MFAVDEVYVRIDVLLIARVARLALSLGCDCEGGKGLTCDECLGIKRHKRKCE